MDARYNNPFSEQQRGVSIEQLWYTWSAVGLDTISAGFRIRAASQKLSDVRSPRLQNLDRYLRYVLPEGTDPFATPPDMAPVCLSFLQSPQGERVLVNKTYTGKDGVGRYGAFFVHLLTDLPTSLSAKDAILLWKSASVWKSSDASIPKEQVILNPLSPHDLILGEYSGLYGGAYQGSMFERAPERSTRTYTGTDFSRISEYLPFVIHAYLTRKPYQRLYIVAHADIVADLIFGLTRCLPRQLLRDLTFSTYEYDVLSKDQVLVVGTCWDKSEGTRRDLPVSCYEQDLAINCESGKKSALEHNPLVARFADYATRCLMTDDFSELDQVIEEIDSEKTDALVGLRAEEFLDHYKNLIEQAEKPTRETLDFNLQRPNLAGKYLSKYTVQNYIIEQAILDSVWLNRVLKLRLTSLLQYQQKYPDIATALFTLGQTAVRKAAEAASANQRTVFDAMYVLIFSVASVNTSRGYNLWKILLDGLNQRPQQNILMFFKSNRDMYYNLLGVWATIASTEGIDVEQLPFLWVPWDDSEAFFSLALPPEWKKVPFLSESISGRVVQRPGPSFRSFIEALIKDLSKTAQGLSMAESLFVQLAQHHYPHKMPLLIVFLESLMDSGRLETLLSRVELSNSELEQFLRHNGPDYLRQPHREAIVLGLFNRFAASVPSKRKDVLYSWLRPLATERRIQLPARSTWFESSTNLDKVLKIAHLTPVESSQFLEDYGEYYLQHYSPQDFSSYHASIIVDYINQYLQDFNPRNLDESRFFSFLCSNSTLFPPSIQKGINKWSSLQSRLANASTKLADLRNLLITLQPLDLETRSQLVDPLARSFAFRVETEVELTSVVYIMGGSFSKFDLLQMLYSIAEIVRDGLVNQDPTTKQLHLELYTRFALCFNSVYDLPSDEHKSFVQSFLDILLQSTDSATFEKLNSTAFGKIAQRWRTYKVGRNPLFGQAIPPGQLFDGMQQPGMLKRYDWRSFLAQPSTDMIDLKAFAEDASRIGPENRSQWVDQFAQSFASCVETEVELTSLVHTLRGASFSKFELLQMLYGMAEIVRDDLDDPDPEKRQHAQHLLEPYTRFALCFDAVYNLSQEEHNSFVQTFLDILLQSADLDTVEKLHSRASGKIAQGWQTYKNGPGPYAGKSSYAPWNGPGTSLGQSGTANIQNPPFTNGPGFGQAAQPGQPFERTPSAPLSQQMPPRVPYQNPSPPSEYQEDFMSAARIHAQPQPRLIERMSRPVLDFLDRFSDHNGQSRRSLKKRQRK